MINFHSLQNNISFNAWKRGNNHTLIIHPTDPTTSFLEGIYQGQEKCLVIKNETDQPDWQTLLTEASDIFCMGHGSPSGLFSVNQFAKCGSYVIDQSNYASLTNKKNAAFIWCHADEFVERFNLKGFYTGMFISEVYEAAYCGLGLVNQELVNESNHAFAACLAKTFHEDAATKLDYVKTEYGKLAKSNSVAAYNCSRLYCR